MKFHQCPDCRKFITFHGKIAEYHDDLLQHAPKVKWVCRNCGNLDIKKNYESGSLVLQTPGKLLALSGADYIQDFGTFDE